jgi:hypothetical protein
MGCFPMPPNRSISSIALIAPMKKSPHKTYRSTNSKSLCVAAIRPFGGGFALRVLTSLGSRESSFRGGSRERNNAIGRGEPPARRPQKKSRTSSSSRTITSHSPESFRNRTRFCLQPRKEGFPSRCSISSPSFALSAGGPALPPYAALSRRSVRGAYP